MDEGMAMAALAYRVHLLHRHALLGQPVHRRLGQGPVQLLAGAHNHDLCGVSHQYP